jgi:hypothetical protein
MRQKCIVLLGVLVCLMGLAPQTAYAHGGVVEGPQRTYLQAIGPYELTVTVEIPLSVPAILFVDIVPRDDVGAATITLRAAPRGLPFDQAPSTQIATRPGPQDVYFAQLPLDRPGDWELELRVEGERGSGEARIPLTVTPAPLPAFTVPLLVTLGALFVLLIAGIIVSAAAQRQQRPAHAAASRIIGLSAFACAVAAAVFGGLQWSTSIEAAQAAAISAASSGRPHVNVALSLDPPRPHAGELLSLTLDLSDGGTGLPVDDLVSHHEALMHLIVLDESGAFMAHLHPSRLAPGRYLTEFSPDRPGRYTAYVEIERQDSGTQIIARDFTIGGEPVPQPAPAPGLGRREVGAMQVAITSSLEPLTAGKQTTLTFDFSEGGQPVNDIQAWLGMAGHVLARSADGATFAHVHAAEPMAPSGPTAMGTRYGPTVRFVYTFPRAGVYQVWAQFKRGGKILTVPLTLKVTP